MTDLASQADNAVHDGPSPSPPPERVDWRDRQVFAWVADRFSVVALIAVLALLAAMPIFWVLRLSFADAAGPLRRVVGEPAFMGTVWTTVRLALGGTVIAAILGTTLAWFGHRLPRGRRWLALIPIAPLLVPIVAVVSGWGFLYSPRIGYMNALLRDLLPFVDQRSGPFNVYTITGITLVTGLHYTAFVYLFVRSALAQLHQDVIDAASIAGAGPLRTFLSVVVPLVRPALAYGVVTVFLLAMGQFTVPLLLGSQSGVRVFSTEMFAETSYEPVDYGAAASFGVPVVIAGLLLIVWQRAVTGDQSKYVTTGGRSSRPLVSTGVAGQVSLALYGVVTIALPLLALLSVALSPFWLKDINVGQYSLANFEEVLSTPSLVRAIENTIRFSALTILIILPVGYLTAKVIYHRRRRAVASAVTETIVGLSVGIPGTVIGLGFLLAFVSLPLSIFGLYGTTGAMIIVFTVVMLPFVVRIQLSAMVNIGDDLSAAGAVGGAGWLRRLVNIELPLLRPALGGAAAMTIAILAQEASASLMVRTHTTEVMSSILYQQWTRGNYPEVAVMAIIMCLVTGVGVALAFAVGGQSAFKGLGS